MKSVHPIPKFINSYNICEPLGEGSFSRVYRCVDKTDNKVYAIKVFPKSNLEDQGDHVRFQREIFAMTYMRHDNLVSLYDFFSDDLNFYLVLDLCPGGALFDYIADNDKLPEPMAAYIFRQIVSAVAYCHSYGVAHRDLKPENVLIEKFPHIRVSDFGLCGHICSGKLMKTFCGSPCYCSPECLCRVQYDGRLSDVWSLGVILYAIVTGEHPWNISNTTLMLRQILKAEYTIPAYISAECKDLIKGMLCLNTLNRYSLEKISNHPWLKCAKSTLVGQNLPEKLPLPANQPITLAELSERSSKSSQRSDHGIISPFEDFSATDDSVDLSHLPGLRNRSSSFTHLQTTKEIEKKPIRRIAPIGLSVAANRQKSSTILVSKKINITPKLPAMMTIEEER